MKNVVATLAFIAAIAARRASGGPVTTPPETDAGAEDAGMNSDADAGPPPCCTVVGKRVDGDAGCVSRESTVLGCRRDTPPNGDGCVCVDGAGCLARTNDGGVTELFFLPSESGAGDVVDARLCNAEERELVGRVDHSCEE